MATIDRRKMREIKLILLAAGYRNARVTYGALARETGLPRSGLNCGKKHVLHQYLRRIGDECRSRRLPSLDFMVVRKDTRQPGRGVDHRIKERTQCTDADLADFEKRQQLVEGLQNEVHDYCLHAAEHLHHLAELLRE